MKAAHFNMPYWDQVAKPLSDKKVWMINEAFLKKQISQNKRILFSHDPSKASGFFGREVKMLSKKFDFKHVSENLWEAVRKND